MAVNSILPPYPIFANAAGEPLEAGYIYVGEPGFEARSTPKTSFFDKLLTIPTGTASGAAVRTVAGFPARNGSPAMIYADEDYSLTVTDRDGRVIYTTLNRTFAFGVEVADIAPILAPDGNFANAGFGFINEQNTGRVRSSTGVVQDVVLGSLVSQQSAAGTSFTLPVSGAGFVEGVTNALSANLTQISGINRTRGDLIRGGATVWEELPLGAAGRNLVSNGTDLVYSTAFAYTDVTASRAVNANYTNSGNRPLAVAVNVTTSAANTDAQFQLGGATVLRHFLGNGLNGLSFCFFFIVPPGVVYRMNISLGSATLNNWHEGAL